MALSTTTTIVTWIWASTAGVVTIVGLMIGLLWRNMNAQFRHTNRLFDGNGSGDFSLAKPDGQCLPQFVQALPCCPCDLVS